MGVSQKDIANILGVTRVSVTRALGDSPLVSAELKAQVKALCQELGYHPHYSSRSLKSSETRVLSVMRWDVKLTDLHSRWVSHLQEDAQKAGYMLRLDPVASFDRIRGEGSADGFILFDDHYPHLSRPGPSVMPEGKQTPMVFLDCPSDDMPFGAVSTDNRGGGVLAAKHLLELGHGSMAYLGVAGWGVGRERYAAFKSELESMGIPNDQVFCIPQERWAEDIKAVLDLEEDIMGAVSQGVTAIFAASDLYAAGAIRIMARHGLSVPRDISVLGYDDSLLSQAYNPPLTTIVQDVTAASGKAVEMLIQRIKTGQTPRSETVAAKLVVRASTAPVDGGSLLTGLSDPDGANTIYRREEL